MQVLLGVDVGNATGVTVCGIALFVSLLLLRAVVAVVVVVGEGSGGRSSGGSNTGGGRRSNALADFVA